MVRAAAFRYDMVMRKTWVAVAAVGLFFAVEIGLRISGAVDFPLYDADSEIGYIPKANQSGSFLRRNDWQFNERHMGVPRPYQPGGVLLVGDSVVLGGNSYRDQERLGPLLQQALGKPVWPVSAGSWALRNELAYLRRNPDVVSGAEQIVFVLNDADFDQASSWSCEYTHPRSSPWVATYYIARKALCPACGSASTEMQVPSGDWRLELKAFLASPQVKAKTITFFLHPRLEQLSNSRKLHDLTRFSDALRQVGAVHVFNIGDDARWKSEFYKDAIHVTANGNAVMARIIKARILSAIGGFS